MIKLRPYQAEAKKAVYTAFKEKGITSMLITMATGLGKTVTFVDIARHFKKVLIVCHREELIMQAYNKIEKYFPFNVGIIKAQRFEIDKQVIVASVQTLYRRLNKMPENMFDHVIIDECHLYAAKTFLEPIHHFKPRLLIGYTATPKRMDGLNLSNIFEEHVFERGIYFGVKEGYLAKPEAYKIQTEINIDDVHKSRGDFQINELSDKVNTLIRNNFVVNKYKEICNGEQAVAYCVDIQHACDLRDVFRDHGFTCETIVSDKKITTDRKGILKDFNDGKIQILTNVEVLTTGWDCIDVGCILHARPTMSETLYIQITGRGLRPKTNAFFEKFGHRNCFILDFVDNCGKHSLINSASLEKHKPLEDRIFLNTQEKEERLQKLADKKERDIRIKNMYKDTQKVNLLKLPEVKVWESARMEEPATEKQLDWLKRLGVFDPDAEYTKKQASEFITYSQVAPWQMKWLAKRGYDVSEGCTIGQYKKIKRSLEQREAQTINTYSNRQSF